MSSKQRRDIPKYHRPIIETHFHLDYLKAAAPSEILAAARAVGVERFMTISVTPDNMPDALALACEHADVYATLGVHPHDAATFNDDAAAYISTHAIHDKVVAVGEIGLDYFYEHCDRTVQRAVFARQLQLAVECQLPVVIHSREADDDTMDILRDYAPHMTHKGVIHSFTSGMALAEMAVDFGFCLGINGIVTFNKADNVREVVAATPLSHLLLETDAPFLTPIPYRGVENAPAYLPFIAEKIAEVKECHVEEVLEQTYNNALRTFFSNV